MYSQLREIQTKNQELQCQSENLRNQLQSQECKNNQELVIIICGVNINTRNIILLSQQLGNPHGHPQHPANSIKSINSRLPLTFHLEDVDEQN
jgi:hypothetical protein